MHLKEFQGWVADGFSSKLGGLPLEYGVARLLTQSGQLGEAILHKGDVSKELSDVLFVLAALANRSGVDLEAAIKSHLTSKTPEEFLSSLDRR